MVRRWAATFVLELDGGAVNPRRTYKTGRAYSFFPATGDELFAFEKGEPMELRVHLRQGDGLRVLATVEDQSSSSS